MDLKGDTDNRVDYMNYKMDKSNKEYMPMSSYTSFNPSPYGRNHTGDYYPPSEGQQVRDLQQELKTLNTMLKDKDKLINTLIEKIVGLVGND